jgi:hypothetical protein
MKPCATLLPVFAAFFLSACGDPLAINSSNDTNSYRGDPIFSLHGQVQESNGVHDEHPANGMSAGVLFLKRQSFENGGGILLSTVKAKLTGDYPADFSLDFLKEPSVYPLDGWDIGLFAPNNAPDAFAVGYLMVGPTAGLEALPDEVQGGFADSLMPLLTDITVTPIQVLFAEGVESTDVVYPSVDEEGNAAPETGLSISSGFTLVDASRFFVGGAYSACYENVLGETYDNPDFLQCIAENADRIACGDACPFEDWDAYLACLTACDDAYPGQMDSNGCLVTVGLPVVLVVCGEEPVITDYPEIRILDPNQPIEITVGDDDVKGGLSLQFGY